MLVATPLRISTMHESLQLQVGRPGLDHPGVNACPRKYRSRKAAQRWALDRV